MSFIGGILINSLTQFSQFEFNEDEILKKFGVKSTSDFNIKNAQFELSKVNVEEEIKIKSGLAIFKQLYLNIIT